MHYLLNDVEGDPAAGRTAGVRLWRNCLAWSPIPAMRPFKWRQCGDPAVGRTASVRLWRNFLARSPIEAEVAAADVGLAAT